MGLGLLACLKTDFLLGSPVGRAQIAEESGKHFTVELTVSGDKWKGKSLEVVRDGLEGSGTNWLSLLSFPPCS